MSERMEMTIGVSMVLSEVTEKILYSIEEKDGKKVLVDRDIPFRLRYRLNRNRTMFNRDVQFFNREKLLLLAQYGEPSEDGRNVVITDEKKMEMYRDSISRLLDSKVEHSIMTVEIEDIEKISDSDIRISPDAMTLFIGYMTNDPELKKDLSSDVILRKMDAPVSGESSEIPSNNSTEDRPEATPSIEAGDSIPGDSAREDDVKTPARKKSSRKRKSSKNKDTADTAGKETGNNEE